MENATLWQTLSLLGLSSWVLISSYIDLTVKLRSCLRPYVARLVILSTPLILKIQRYHRRSFDLLFSALSSVVSVPFYTGFLPLLFWSGHCRFARQMTLLMAFCDYIGNCIKDVISAPRPSCPPVRRLTATKEEADNALEYGLPSSHTLNTVCLSGYMLHYILSHSQNEYTLVFAGFAFLCLFVGLVAFGRIYSGMHSLVDIIGGLTLGVMVLGCWFVFDDYIDNFIISKQNVTSFWAALSFLLLFAYPTPESPTPSFEFHTAFNGVALGIVAGVQQTYNHFHHEAVPRIFTPQLTLLGFLGRILMGIPTILVVKFCSKALAKWILPVVSNMLGIRVTSAAYIPTLNPSAAETKHQHKHQGHEQPACAFFRQDSFDIDTGIRFLQYAGLAWSVVDLVPSLFSILNL